VWGQVLGYIIVLAFGFWMGMGYQQIVDEDREPPRRHR
jgi:hypothetical protein